MYTPQGDTPRPPQIIRCTSPCYSGNPVPVTSGAAAGDSQYFFSDIPELALEEVNGEICLRAPLTPWMALQEQLDAGGTVTLTNDYAALYYENPLNVANAVTLDLNGHTLAGSGGGWALRIYDGGHLTLTNSVEGTGRITGGGVHVLEDGEFTMNGGEISGSSAKYGGGVYMDYDGSFVLSRSPVILALPAVTLHLHERIQRQGVASPTCLTE